MPLIQTTTSLRNPRSNTRKNRKPASRIFDDLVQVQPAAFVIVDQNGIIRFINKAATDQLSRFSEPYLGNRLVLPYTSKKPRLVSRVSKHTGRCFIELQSRKISWNGDPSFLVCMWDVTGLVTKDIQSQNQVNELTKQLEIITELTNEFAYIFTIHSDGEIEHEWISLGFMKLTGLDLERIEKSGGMLNLCHPDDREILSQGFLRLAAGEDFSGDLRISDRIQNPHWFHLQARPVPIKGESQASRVFVNAHEITKWKREEEKWHHVVMHDGLTGLPNRLLMMDRLVRTLEQVKHQVGYLSAVLILDINRFKLINDCLGHSIGDLILITVARRIEKCLRTVDSVSRLGGDEFAIIMGGIQEVDDAMRIAKRIQEELASPILVNGQEIVLSASYGIASVNGEYDRPEEILRDADTAMNRAKANRNNQILIFSGEMHEKSLKLLTLESELQRAIQKEEFVLHYQPIVSQSDDQVTTVEALLRWQHPSRGLIPPSEFISLAEDTGLIIKIGKWVLETACAQVKKWQEAGFSNLQLAVNLSACQLQDQELAKMIQRIIQQSGIPGKSLQLEITESAAMKDFDLTVKTLYELNKMGVSISIDDFGINYSSFGYLRQFPINCIKIDRSFILDVVDNMDDAAITKAIIALAHMLNIRVVAEGVETDAQLNFLKPQQCDEVQGYLVSPPVPADVLFAFLNNYSVGATNQK